MVNQGEILVCVESLPLVTRLREGFSPDKSVAYLLDPGFLFLPRTDDVERDESIRQVCTYTLVTSGRRVFCYRRKGREERLDGLLSLGVGGHVTTEDMGAAERTRTTVARGIDAAAEREVSEELTLEGDRVTSYLGLVRDDSTPVGRVHVGACYRIELPTPRATVVDGSGLVEPAWMSWEGARERAAEFEPWSRAILEGPGPIR